VRDVARFFDVCNGFDRHDTLSLPRVDGWEQGLGSHDLHGLRVAVEVDLGAAVVRDEVRSLVTDAAETLIKQVGLSRENTVIEIPNGGLEWALSNSVSLLAGLGDRYPECNDDLTPEIQFGLNILLHTFDASQAAAIESLRSEMNDVMAKAFDEVDLVICATNPDVAFAAEGPLPTSVGGVDLVSSLGFEKALVNNAVLTVPANMAGNPAITLPVGFVDGLPVGMQVIGRHHQEQLLLDLALAFQREKPWPLPPRLDANTTVSLASPESR
jgi:aspartyl-tRNA(Asn)/glutamyl-tRNA(Gln) amidotransferase subunit A